MREQDDVVGRRTKHNFFYLWKNDREESYRTRSYADTGRRSGKGGSLRGKRCEYEQESNDRTLLQR